MKRISILLSTIVLACGPTVSTDPGGTTGNTDDDDGPGSNPETSVTVTSADTTGPTTVTTSPTSASTDGGVDSTTESNDENPFITAPDVDPPFECDQWIDDCPRGTKCMPWANDGGGSWNATKCTPLAEDPHQPGEPCTVEGNGVSGIDDCEARSMCWNPDPETNMGECVAFCTGSEANPSCADPCSSCALTGDGVLILCLPGCDPLAPDCNEGEGCYATNESFTCVFDASGDMGAAGEPCEFLNACDPGQFCANADAVPDCGATGCCTPFCDHAAADPCAGVGDGVECVPWFEDGQAPPCSTATIGVCVLPT